MNTRHKALLGVMNGLSPETIEEVGRLLQEDPRLAPAWNNDTQFRAEMTVLINGGVNDLMYFLAGEAELREERIAEARRLMERGQ